MSKYLCLSFDDGPNLPGDDTMNNMLDLLEEYKIPASFFLIGNKITAENEKVIRRAMALGCDIQNHSWSHPYMSKLSAREIKEEYQKCDDAIIKITGIKPSFFRPPCIDVGQIMYDNLSVPFICGRGCFDWERDRGLESRYKLFMEAVDNGTIFLLHVSEGNSITWELVKRVVPELKAQGYEFVNLPDLFKKCGVNPAIEHSLWRIAKNGSEENLWSEE